MKKYLFLTFILTFALSASAQKLPSVEQVKSQPVGENVSLTENVDEQVKTALLKDKDLQKEAFSFLKSNPKTASTFSGLASKKMGSSSSLIKSVLGNKDLASAAINYITSNPKLLEKAMKIVGM